MARPARTPPTRLSESPLWTRLRSFYEQRGPQAWNVDGVPNHVTINPGMAMRYAHVALRYAQDCRRLGLSLEGRPFPVVELGAGSGGFGYRLALAMAGLQRDLDLGSLGLVQVISDLAQSNLEAWRRQSGLGRLLTVGGVEAARFDVLGGTEVGPVGRGPVDPPVFLANYLFDSLPMDLFRVSGGRLQEGLVSLEGLPRDEAPADLQRVRTAWTYRPARPDYYGDPDIDAVLADCVVASDEDYWVLFPVGAMRCLRNLHVLVEGPMLVIAADLGTTRFPSFTSAEPGLTTPGAYFYGAVDFGLLGRYAARLGGDYMHQPRDRSLNIALFSFGQPFSALNETRVAADTFFAMVSHSVISESIRHMADAGAPPPLPLFVELAAAGSFDPSVFDSMFELLMAEYASGVYPAALWDELVEMLDRFADNVFAIPEGPDTYFNIGSLLQQMGRYQRAIDYYRRSEALYGENTPCLYNIGLCRWFTGDEAGARGDLARVLELDPSNVMARGWLAQIEHERAKPAPPRPLEARPRTRRARKADGVLAAIQAGKETAFR
jgi:hypothetical protein